MNFAAINPIAAQSERQCRHSTDAFMRELELWTSSSSTLPMPLYPCFDPQDRPTNSFPLLALARDMQRMAASDAGGKNSIPFAEFMEPERTGRASFRKCNALKLGCRIK